MNSATTHASIGILSLFQEASLLVQILIAGLMLVSLVSWTMIFRKWTYLKSAFRDAERFEEKFWSGGNVNQMYAELTRREGVPLEGMANVFVAGFREYSRLEKQR
ncbi:MAG TPA: hypothetical protein VFN52_01860, partial [Acidiferrobacteraceae bacterium]|nr:hypothetical protein [Acidiferrobacteraceae bacterium]